MRRVIKTFFTSLFPGSGPSKPLLRQSRLDPQILGDIERIVEVDESVITDRSTLTGGVSTMKRV